MLPIMKSVKSLTVKAQNPQKSTKSKPRNQISLLVYLPITSGMQIKLLCHEKLPQKLFCLALLIYHIIKFLQVVFLAFQVNHRHTNSMC